MSDKTKRQLRMMLSERGEEWTSGNAIKPDTTWVKGNWNHNVKFEPWGESTFKVTLYDLTPEQAIAVTLGSGTCEMEYGGDVTADTARVMGVYFCSECGSPNYNDCMPYHCIYCGKAVMT